MINKKHINVVVALTVIISFMLLWSTSFLWQNSGTSVQSSAVLAIPNNERLNLEDVTNQSSYGAGSFSTLNGGSYSSNNPYVISSRDDLIRLAYYVNNVGQPWASASYVLTDHINLAGFNWEPIGTRNSPFCGNFDGNGYSIFGLTIVDGENVLSDYAGLFGYISINDSNTLCRISRLGLKDTIIISSRKYVGAFVGYANSDFAIQNPWVGYKNDNDNPRAFSEVNSEAKFAIQDCYNVGYIQGGMFVGGFVGYLINGVIFNSYCYGMEIINELNDHFDVCSVKTYPDSYAYVGGLVGKMNYNITTPFLVNTITVMRVGRTLDNEPTNLGHVVGGIDNKTLVSTDDAFLNKYDTNFFATDFDNEDGQVREFNTEIGSGYSINYLTRVTDGTSSVYYSTLLDFGRNPALSCVSAENAIWMNPGQTYTGSIVKNTVWIQGTYYNNGLPVLWNVPQLIKISFRAVINDEDITDVTAENGGLVGFGCLSQSSYEFLDEITGTYIFEQGKVGADAFNMTSGDELSLAYEFDRSNLGGWKYQFRHTRISNQFAADSLRHPGFLNYSNTIGYACHDCEIICGFKYRTYDIDLTVDYSDNAKIYIQESGYSVEVSDENPITFMSNSVMLLIDFQDGYYVTGFDMFGVDCSEFFTAIDGGYSFNLGGYLNSEKYSTLDKPLLLQLNITSELQKANVRININAPVSNVISVYDVTTEDELVNSIVSGTQFELYYGNILHLEAVMNSLSYEFAGWTITQDGTIYQGTITSLPELDYVVGACSDVVITANACKHQIAVSSENYSYSGGSIELTSSSPANGEKFDYDSTVTIAITPSEGYTFRALRLFRVTQDTSTEILNGEDYYYVVDQAQSVYYIDVVLADYAGDETDYDYRFDLVFDINTYSINFNVVNLDANGVVVGSSSVQVGNTQNPDIPQTNNPNFVRIDNTNGDILVNVTAAQNNSYDSTAVFNIDVLDLVGYEIESIIATQNGQNVELEGLNETNTFFGFKVLADTLVTIQLKEKAYAINVDAVKFVDESNGFSSGKTFDKSFITIIQGNDAFAVGTEFSYGALSSGNVIIEIVMPIGFEFVPNSLMLSNTEVAYSVDGNKVMFNVLVMNNNDLDYTFNYKQRTVDVSISLVGADDFSLLVIPNSAQDVSSDLKVVPLNYGGEIIISCASISEGLSNYEFAYWLVGGIKVSAEKTLYLKNIIQDTLVSAVFETKLYWVDVQIGQLNSGNFNSSRDCGKVSHPSQITFNQPITLLAEENFGYCFVGWYRQVFTEDNEFYFELVESDIRYSSNKVLEDFSTSELGSPRVSIFAVFGQLRSLIVEVCQAQAGGVGVKEDVASPMSSVNYYYYNSPITLTAQPNPRWTFDYYEVDGQIIREASYSFVLDSNKVIQANFKPEYALNLSLSNKNYGKVNTTNLENDPNYVRLEADAESNCDFIGWVVNGVMVNTNDVFILKLNGDIDVEAVFKKKFDWSTLVLIFGVGIFVIVTIALISYYIQRREEEPLKVRVLLDAQDDKAVLQKKTKRDVYRDVIEPVPVRSVAKKNISPIPIRKINVAPMKHNGVVVGRKNNNETK